jgi:pSer/pThr/pTyr-binding forkhead associated (FHA) protein
MGGCVALRDLGSRNGTLVNGRPAERDVALKNGDLITLGAVGFRVGLEVRNKAAEHKREHDAHKLAQTVPLNQSNDVNPHAHVRPVFLIVTCAGKKREFLLDKPVSTIGRREGDIRVSDPSLSRKHFQVEIHENHVCIKDLASANGTYVNGHPISYFRALDEVTFTAGGSTFQLVTGPRRS